jgi:putative phosphoribosyl transferase
VDALRSEADEIVCLETPEPFFAISLHYGDFHQLGDDEVAAIMQAAAGVPDVSGKSG